MEDDAQRIHFCNLKIAYEKWNKLLEKLIAPQVDFKELSAIKEEGTEKEEEDDEERKSQSLNESTFEEPPQQPVQRPCPLIIKKVEMMGKIIDPEIMTEVQKPMTPQKGHFTPLKLIVERKPLTPVSLAESERPKRSIQIDESSNKVKEFYKRKKITNDFDQSRKLNLDCAQDTPHSGFHLRTILKRNKTINSLFC